MIASFSVISPIDDSVYVERSYAQRSDIDACLAQSSDAQKAWKRVPLTEKKALCCKAMEYLKAQSSSIAEELAWQMGRPIRYGALELDGMVERASYMMVIAEQALASIPGPEQDGLRHYIQRVPLGVCFVLAPWNYPFLTAVNSIVPALLAGNSVILKHSAQTPLVAERFAQAFAAAGLPAGVFQYLHLGHEDAAYLMQQEAVQAVIFTGSVEGGRQVEKNVAGRFISVGLELGGKDPAYLREDVDLSTAVPDVLDGAFFNSGQSCCGIERIYVHHSRYEAFLQQAQAFVADYFLGPSQAPETTIGPMVNAKAANFVRGQILEAEKAGARAIIDPSQWPDYSAQSAYLAPQIMADVNHSMRIMQEESFGPVVGVMSVKDDEEAIALMNDSRFGLTASVFTQDIERGIHIGERIETGTFFVNRCDYLDPALAWTGVKQSGRGCALSALGFAALTRAKSFHVKWIPR